MELENDKWVPTDASVSRRTLVSGLIGAGFALAVSPVEASYVQTSPDGLDAGMKTFKCADNVEMNVYVAHPKGAKSLIDMARTHNKKYQVVELPMGHHQMGETPEETLQALKEVLG